MRIFYHKLFSVLISTERPELTRTVRMIKYLSDEFEFPAGSHFIFYT